MTDPKCVHGSRRLADDDSKVEISGDDGDLWVTIRPATCLGCGAPLLVVVDRVGIVDSSPGVVFESAL